MSTNDDLDHRKMMDWVRPDIAAHGNVIGMLATTFELDPTFFGSDYLPTFLGLGAWEDTSFERGRHATLAQTRQRCHMDAAGRGRPRPLHMSTYRWSAPPGIKLHAKVLLVAKALFDCWSAAQTSPKGRLPSQSRGRATRLSQRRTPGFRRLLSRH
jgi:hypothetical protein